jgi:hypothetical protein
MIISSIDCSDSLSQLRALFLLILISLHLLQLRPLDLPANRLRQETRVHEVDLPGILIRRGILLAEVLQRLLQCVLVLLLVGTLSEHNEGFYYFVALRVRGGDHSGFDDRGVHL